MLCLLRLVFTQGLLLEADSALCVCVCVCVSACVFACSYACL